MNLHIRMQGAHRGSVRRRGGALAFGASRIGRIPWPPDAAGQTRMADTDLTTVQAGKHLHIQQHIDTYTNTYTAHTYGHVYF
jgi:hypothetical protein